MAATTPAFRMADRLLDGHLADLLRRYRAEHVSWDEIARRLYEEGGVEATPGTLRQWYSQLPDESDESKAAS